jgi:hypothetical protein
MAPASPSSLSQAFATLGPAAGSGGLAQERPFTAPGQAGYPVKAAVAQASPSRAAATTLGGNAADAPLWSSGPQQSRTRSVTSTTRRRVQLQSGEAEASDADGGTTDRGGSGSAQRTNTLAYQPPLPPGSVRSSADAGAATPPASARASLTGARAAGNAAGAASSLTAKSSKGFHGAGPDSSRVGSRRVSLTGSGALFSSSRLASQTGPPMAGAPGQQVSSQPFTAVHFRLSLAQPHTLHMPCGRLGRSTGLSLLEPAVDKPSVHMRSPATHTDPLVARACLQVPGGLDLSRLVAIQRLFEQYEEEQGPDELSVEPSGLWRAGSVMAGGRRPSEAGGGGAMAGDGVFMAAVRERERGDMRMWTPVGLRGRAQRRGRRRGTAGRAHRRAVAGQGYRAAQPSRPPLPS